MDYLESLGKQISEITMYDVKSYYNQAKNMVMNFTEMESKVREATNNDAWGASMTLMNEIAQATNNYQLFNEIMPTIYKRFTEKEASEWRQIYKALQLLEHLVKNGSERVVDDARQHLSMIKILRNFHYTDEKGKDQGINVRNRSKELANLLGDLELVRAERRKARANKQKYSGISSTGSGSSGGRYGGFGSDSGYQGGGSDSPVSGSSASAWREPVRSSRQDDYDDYDAGEWDDRKTGKDSPDDIYRPSRSSNKPVPDAPKEEKAAPKKEVNLFDDDDWDEPVSAPSQPTSTVKTATLDDDFDDFQSAGPSATQSAPKPQPMATATLASKPNFFDMMNTAQPAQPQPQPASRPLSGGYSSAPVQTNNIGSLNFNQTTLQPSTSTQSTFSQQPLKPASTNTKSSGAAFDDIWSSFGSSSTTNQASKPGGQTMADLAKQKSDAQIWNSSANNNSTANKKSDGFDDLLF